MGEELGYRYDIRGMKHNVIRRRRVSKIDIFALCNMSGLLFENSKHTIAKVLENANRHGGKNTTITK